MKRKGLLDHVTFDAPGAARDRVKQSSVTERDEWDARALLYIDARLKTQEKEFRKKLDKLIKDNPLKRGPDLPDKELPPHSFYELIKEEKRRFELQNVWKALEFHCKLRSLPTDEHYLTHLYNKYTEGSRKAAKKMR